MRISKLLQNIWKLTIEAEVYTNLSRWTYVGREAAVVPVTGSTKEPLR